jgi:hypothetical protein
VTRALPALLDAVLVVVFAAVGRRSHAEGVDVAGILRTAWPFLAGAAAGWVVASLTVGEPRSLGFGGVVVAATVVVGMALRLATGQGTAWSFVVVATVVLTVFLLGWRLVARLVA